MLLLSSSLEVTNTSASGVTPSLSSSFFHIGEKLHELCSSLKAKLAGRFVTKETQPLAKQHQAILQVALDVLIPINYEEVKGSYRMGDDFVSIQLTPPDGALFKNGKAVRKINFWFYLKGYIPGMKTDESSPKARFLLEYSDKTSQGFALPKIKPVDSGVVFAGNLFRTFIEAGADVEAAYLNHNKRVVADWMTNIQPSAKILRFYSKAYPKLATILATALRENGLYKEKAAQCGVQLSLFGTEEQAVFKSVIGSALSKEPETFCISNNAIFQIAADKNLNIISFAHKENSDALRLAIFVEVLSDPVAATTYAALEILHQVSGYDLILVTGYSPVLLTKDMFEKAGWSVSLTSTNLMFSDTPSERFLPNSSPDIRNHYVLKPMCMELRRSYLQEQSSLRFGKAGIDLSLSSKPLDDIALFDALSTIRQVDISWCAFKEKELEIFLDKFGDNLEIFASGDESWFYYLSQMADIKVTKRLDHKMGEIAPFAPHIAKKIGYNIQLF